MSPAPSLVTITASGGDASVERALCIATDLSAVGFTVQILAFDDFAARVNSSGVLFCSAPGDLAAFDASVPGTIAANRYLASAVSGMPMTLDARLRDSTMIVMCDEHPLIPSIAEARGLPIYRVPVVAGKEQLGSGGFTGWLESIRLWHAVRGPVNDMRMFLGLHDFASPRSYRRSISRIPVFTLSSIVALKPHDSSATASAVQAQPNHRLSA